MQVAFTEKKCIQRALIEHRQKIQLVTGSRFISFSNFSAKDWDIGAANTVDSLHGSFIETQYVSLTILIDCCCISAGFVVPYPSRKKTKEVRRRSLNLSIRVTNKVHSHKKFCIL